MSTGDKKVLSNLVKRMKNSDVDPLSPLIDRYLLDRERPENESKRLVDWTIHLKPNRRPLGRISPSSIGGCQRQAAFKFVGVGGTKRVNPDTELIFEDGHWRHHKWQAMMTEMESILGSNVFRCYSIEQRVSFKMLRVRGDLDVHIGIFDRGEFVDWVVDIKGINKWGFQDIHASQQPKPAHVLQLLAYMRSRKVRRGILLYDCKDDNRYKIFTIKFTSKGWEEVSEWCEGVLHQIEYERLPPMHPDCDNGTFLYEKCPYRKLCFGDFTAAKLERMTYRDFPGIDTLWKEGIKREREG